MYLIQYTSVFDKTLRYAYHYYEEAIMHEVYAWSPDPKDGKVFDSLGTASDYLNKRVSDQYRKYCKVLPYHEVEWW